MLSLTGAIGRVNPQAAINALQGVVLVRTVSEEFFNMIHSCTKKKKKKTLDPSSLINMN